MITLLLHVPYKRGEKIRYCGDRHPSTSRPGDLGIVVGWVDHARVGRYYLVRLSDGLTSLWPWDEVESSFLN
jgi:hypothetical protein